jgi:hypothetical protein
MQRVDEVGGCCPLLFPLSLRLLKSFLYEKLIGKDISVRRSMGCTGGIAPSRREITGGKSRFSSLQNIVWINSFPLVTGSGLQRSEIFYDKPCLEERFHD